MARKKAMTTKTKAVPARTTMSQARLDLPAEDMERVRQAARSVGLSLSAFIRQAVLTTTADTERRMGL